MSITVVVRPEGSTAEATISEQGRVTQRRHISPVEEYHSFHLEPGQSVVVQEVPAARASEHPGMEAAMSPSPSAPEPSVAGSARPLPVRS